MSLRAEGDFVVRPSRASEGARLVILWVTVRIWAEPLEVLGVVSRSTVVGRRSGAAVFIRLENRAWVAAGPVELKGCRALSHHIGGAVDVVTATRCRGEVHGDVEAINEGDIVEVEVLELAKGVLSERVGWGAVGGALEDTAAVAGLTAALAVGVKAAACASPDATAGGAGRGGDGPGLAGVELLASTGDAGSPDGVGALVDDVEGGGVSNEGEEEEE